MNNENKSMNDEMIKQIIIADQIMSGQSSSSTIINRQINQLHIMEGENITMDCLYRAKPNATVIRWSHNHDEIWQEKSGLFVFSSSSFD